MKELEEIKNATAKENGYKDWDDLHDYYVEINSPFNIILDQVAKRYATESIKADRERVKRAIRYPLGFIDGKIANEERIDNLPIELK